ncbi:MAG: ABC transporter ATP-binding protein [Alphaproteobacteria bacterium]|nr:ABC transporter ATP-binding protein [Alphaproteobacteria bacterium]
MSVAGCAIDVQALTKRYNGKTVVDKVSIRVPRGKIYGFLGPNGSGKTTTIRMLCGLITPDFGKGTCLGFDVRTESEKIRRRTGYMTQKFSYWEDLSIEENLKFVADMFGLDNPDERVEETLKRLNLASRRNQLAGKLSGGWKQRLALAACIMHDPELLLLDEPTAGVDPQARREFWDHIHALAAKGLTVLVSTHYMDEAERCHAIIYIAYGRIVTSGTAEEVIAHAGLTTWTVEGRDLSEVRNELQSNPAVSTSALFGNTLHVSGPDAESLRKAMRTYCGKPGYICAEAPTSLEDAFIHFMSRIKEE